MSALCTVGDVFSDPEFSAPGNSFLWDLVRWKSSTVSALGSSLCRSAHMSGVWIHMAAACLTTQRWAPDLVINPLTSLCSYISVPLTCLAPTASCAANRHNKEEWNAGITNVTVREGDVHDCDPVRQGHVSAFLVTSSEFARESLASQFCSPTVSTLGRLAASLCDCLCLCPARAGRDRAESETGLSSLVPDQQWSLPLMICFFDWDPGDPEHSAQTNSMPNREPCAHSSNSSTVSSGQLPPTPRVLRQSYTLMMLHVELEMSIPDDWDPGDPEQSAYSYSMPPCHSLCLCVFLSVCLSVRLSVCPSRVATPTPYDARHVQPRSVPTSETEASHVDAKNHFSGSAQHLDTHPSEQRMSYLCSH